MTYKDVELKADLTEKGNPAFLGWGIVVLIMIGLFVLIIRLGGVGV